MFKSFSSTIAAMSLCLWCSSVSAQADEWAFEGTFYLFTAETKSGIGGNDVTLSFGDALENLDVAAMGAIVASRGPWTFIADYMLTDLSFEGPPPDPSFSGSQVSVRTQVATGVALYNVYDSQRFFLDLGGGIRWFDTETELKLRPGSAPGASLGEDDSWIDPIVTARLRYEFSPRWSAAAIVDFGSFVEDRETWQMLLTASYMLNDSWVARFGYRFMRVENDEDDQDYLFEQSGPVVGIAFRF